MKAYVIEFGSAGHDDDLFSAVCSTFVVARRWAEKEAVRFIEDEEDAYFQTQFHPKTVDAASVIVFDKDRRELCWWTISPVEIIEKVG